MTNYYQKFLQKHPPKVQTTHKKEFVWEGLPEPTKSPEQLSKEYWENRNGRT